MKKSVLVLGTMLLMLCTACRGNVESTTTEPETHEETITATETTTSSITLKATTESITEATIDVYEADTEEVIVYEDEEETSLYPVGLPIDNYEEVLEKESHLEYIGHYELTAYEWTGNPCANGNYPTEGYTVACNSLPLGTRIYIDGYGYYTVEDRGGMADNVVDIYLGDYDTCIEFGRQSRDIYIVHEEE